MSKSSKLPARYEIEYASPHSLKSYRGNARTHNRKQLRALEASIRRFGFTQPALVTTDSEIIAGHGRVEAAKNVGLPLIPIIRIEHLNETDRRAYILADNKLALMAGWDKEILAVELQHLIEAGFEVEITGFEPPEVDLLLNAAAEAHCDPDADDVIPAGALDRLPVTRPGNTWLFGSSGGPRHQLICGDARDSSVITTLMGGEHASLILSDPPFNVRVSDVSGKGRARHAEFAMASGEMTEQEYILFLKQFLATGMMAINPGALIYLFMDWRHLFEILTAAKLLNLTFINLCVWNKTNGGMGSLYRSKHELILIFRNGETLHRNNVELGKNGRNRSNVWDYAGVNTFRSDRDAELAMHPTVKPVAMIADAIRDVTKRGDIILDQFCGSGTTIIAAEKTGRVARAVEIDGHYCDVAVRRWEALTGKPAILAETGQTFEEVADHRENAAVRGKNENK
jgi:DNA modification methylase